MKKALLVKKSGRPLKILYFFMLLLATVYIVTAFFFCETNITNLYATEDILELEPVSESEPEDGVLEFTLTVPDPERSNRMLEFLTSHCDVVVYGTDDQVVYSISAVPSIYGKSSGTRLNLVNIPYGESEIRVVVSETFATSGSADYTFYYGDSVKIICELIRDSVVSAMISWLIIAFGLVILIYWLVMHRKTNDSPALVYFGVLTILLGLWSFNETDAMMVLMTNRTVGSAIGYILLMLLPIPILTFSKFFYQNEDVIVCNIFAGISLIVFFTLTILHISGVLCFKQSVLIIHAVLLLALGYMVVSMAGYVRRNGMNRRSVVNFIALAILIVSAGMDLGSYYMGLQNTDAAGKVGLLLYIGILAGETLTDSMKQIEEGRKAELYKEMAVTDLMTGLYNRSAFEQWEESCSPDEQLMLVTFDLNNLKWHNDNLGHAAGDEYIISSARIIRDVFGVYGKCYRIGGDEFCVVIPPSKRFDIEKQVEVLRKEETEYNLKSSQVKMHIAYGYAVKEERNESIEDARSRADEMMYENKKSMKETEA